MLFFLIFLTIQCLIYKLFPLLSLLRAPSFPCGICSVIHFPMETLTRVCTWEKWRRASVCTINLPGNLVTFNNKREWGEERLGCLCLIFNMGQAWCTRGVFSLKAIQIKFVAVHLPKPSCQAAELLDLFFKRRVKLEVLSNSVCS